jgi:hypothetical protein
VLIEALTPTSIPDVAEFKAHRSERDFNVWCETNPVSCLRRFDIQDLFDYEIVDVSDLDKEYVRGQESIAIAYPEMEALYGAAQRRARHDIMREDLRQIKTTVGLPGYGNYTDGLTRNLAVEYVDLEAVTLMVLFYRFEFYEAV